MKNLLKQLIRSAPTAANGELRAAETLKEFFDRCGIGAETDCWDPAHANLLARLPSSQTRPALLFASHLDVVPAGTAPWSVEPFAATEKDGKIFGRGAVDMLSALAAISAAMAEIKEQNIPLAGDVILAAAAAEETDSAGIKRFLRTCGQALGPTAGIVITEPTDLKVMRAHRGILWLEITSIGKATHGSMPELGVNAIDKMRLFLNRLEQYKIPHQPHPLLGSCIMSVNTIAGGQATNIIPDRCCVAVDIRTLPNQPHNQITADIEKILKQLKSQDPQFNANLNVVRSVPALETDADEPFVKSACSALDINTAGAVGFTTDGPWLAKLNAPIIILGPGNPSLCHGPDEYIEISQLDKAKEIYRKLILAFQT